MKTCFVKSSQEGKSFDYLNKLVPNDLAEIEMSWYRSLKKQSQIEPQSVEGSPMARYRGIMLYEVRVPSTGNQQQDQQVAEQESSSLYQKVFGAVGDSVFSYDPPEFYGRTRR